MELNIDEALRYLGAGRQAPPELRREVTALLSEMHDLYRRGHTPKVKPTKACSACSLKSLCLPKLMRGKSVSSYLRGAMEGAP